MGDVIRFTKERREAFLTQLEQGKTQLEACETVKVSHVTVQRWLRKGKVSDSGPAFEFVQAYERIPRPPRRRAAHELVTQERQGGLSEEQLVSLLEQAALDGNVQAQKYLLERPWERKRDDEKQEEQASDVLDELQAFRERKGAA